MSGMELLSLAGIIIGLALLVILIMKGLNIYVVAFIATASVMIFGQMPIYDTLKTTYMSSFAGFVQSYWLIFLTGTIMGKVYDITNGAKAVANVIVKVLGLKFAVVSVPLACGILAYGGVSVYVVSFAVFPIALEVFKAADLPRNYIPAALCFGSATFAMVAPGAPQIQNAIPTSAVGASLMGGTVGGFVTCGLMMVIGCALLMMMIAKEKAKGAHFVAKDVDNFSGDDEAMPNPILAFIPLVITILLINVKINGEVICQLETGVLLGAVIALVLMWKYQNPNKLMFHIGESCKSSLNAICNTSAVVAFGAVVKAAPCFQSVVDAMMNIPGPKILSLAIATTVLAGICGSASGGVGIASPLLGPLYVNMGIPAGVVARTISISPCALDSLPHNGFVVTVCNGLCNETHKSAYFPIFVLTVLLPAVMTIFCVVFFTIFPF